MEIHNKLEIKKKIYTWIKCCPNIFFLVHISCCVLLYVDNIVTCRIASFYAASCEILYCLYELALKIT